MKARYLAIGLLIGALWGLLSTVVFVTVGMFGDNRHPYHWLFQTFQNSMHTLWFRALFLPFLVSFEAGFMFAFFGSTPVGATIGTLMGAVASVLNYRVRKNGQSHSSRKMKESKSEGQTNCYTETINQLSPT